MKYCKYIFVSLYILFLYNKYVYDRFMIFRIFYIILVCVLRNEEVINLLFLLLLNIMDKMIVFIYLLCSRFWIVCSSCCVFRWLLEECCWSICMIWVCCMWWCDIIMLYLDRRCVWYFLGYSIVWGCLLFIGKFCYYSLLVYMCDLKI